MSNPITPITRILLATERLTRRKKREKQKLAPYKIYPLRHNKIQRRRKQVTPFIVSEEGTIY
jgi:hypothetical protein